MRTKRPEELRLLLAKKGYHKVISMPLVAFGSQYEAMPRNAMIVHERIFNGRTLDSISREFGISKARVRQIVLRALRHTLKDEYPGAYSPPLK